MKVLIVGAGMAGLTCAATLDKNKYEITVIDKTDTFGTIGYAVAIWSNGFKVLEKMSIFKKIENKVNIIKHDIISDDKKNFISEIDFNDLRLSYDMGVIKRSDLHNALVLSLSKNINVRMNTVLDKIENTNSGVNVKFKKAHEDTESSKEKGEEFFDIVIGADGVRSQLRNIIFDTKNKSVHKYAYTVWSFWSNVKSNKAFSFLGKGRGYIQYPSDGRSVCTFLAHQSYAKTNKVIMNKKERCLNSFEGFIGGAIDTLSKLEEEEIFEDEMMYVSLPSFFKKRVILIGDAAHALSPLLGMGTTLALEDGFTLAMCMNGIHNETQICQFLQEYSTERVKYINNFRRRIICIEKIYVSESNFMRIVRNVFLKVWGVHLFDLLLGKYIR